MTRLITPLMALKARVYPAIALRCGVAAARTKNGLSVRVGVLTEKGETSVVLHRRAALRFGLQIVWQALKAH